MGAVRHRELIRLLSLVVALEMAVGVVAVAVRSDRSDRGTTQFAGSTGIPLETENGILAGGKLDKRRGSAGSSTTRGTEAPATSATTATTAAPSPTTGQPALTTSSTAAPGTTATTARPPGPPDRPGAPEALRRRANRLPSPHRR